MRGTTAEAAPADAAPKRATGLSPAEARRVAELGEQTVDALLAQVRVAERGMAMLAAARASLLSMAWDMTVADARLFVDAAAPPDSFATKDRDRARADRTELATGALVAEAAAVMGVHERTAEHLVREARTLVDHLPAVHSEMLAGNLSYRHAQRIVDETALLGPEALRRYEGIVVRRLVPGMTPGQVGRVARRARELAHPEPIAERHARAVQGREVWIEPARDGMASLCAVLPAPVAAAIDDRLERAAGALTNAGDPRGRQQLRADVLMGLLVDGRRPTAPSDPSAGTVAVGGGPAAGAGGGSGDDLGAFASLPRLAELASAAHLARSIVPRVQVTVPALALLDPGGTGAASPAAPTGEPAATTDRWASLDGWCPVPVEVAAGLVARAPSMRRLLTDPESGTVLSVGRKSYRVPADLRAHLQLRDGTCRFPGCTVPVRRCDVDHTVAWTVGGCTDADNLAHLCRRHHRLKHETRWSVRQDPGGVLVWTSPTGVEYPTLPAWEPPARGKPAEVAGPPGRARSAEVARPPGTRDLTEVAGPTGTGEATELAGPPSGSRPSDRRYWVPPAADEPPPF